MTRAKSARIGMRCGMCSEVQVLPTSSVLLEGPHKVTVRLGAAICFFSFQKQ